MNIREINISNMLKETSPTIYPFLSTFIRMHRVDILLLSRNDFRKIVSFQESMYIDRERHLDRKLASYLASTRSLHDREIADRVTVLLSTD